MTPSTETNMKASELRIGNIVLFQDGDEIPVLSEDICSFAYGQLELEPIPLTSEWLERFGFAKTTNISHSTGQPRSYGVWTANLLTYNEIQDLWWWHGATLVKQLQHVHQLQNLYFALTGKELELKPEQKQ